MSRAIARGAWALRRVNEIRSLTGLRGVAALYVLLFHYVPVDAADGPLQRALSHGYLAVDLFFVLSGFVMALTYRHLFADGWTKAAYATFLQRRIARISPLYTIAIVTGCALVGFHWLPFTPTMPRPAALALNLIMVQAWGLSPSFDSPAWSISAEWAAYLLFPALLIPAFYRTARDAWVAAAMSAVMLFALCALPASVKPDYLVADPLNMNGYWMGLPVLRCLPEFTLGILAFRFSSTPLGMRLAGHGWVANALAMSAALLLTVPRCDLAFVLLLPFLVGSLAHERHLPGRVLASWPAHAAGVLSFSIYLTHKLLLGVLTWSAARYEAAGIPHARMLAAAGCIVVTFALASAAYRWIEVPGRRWLRGLGARRKVHAETDAACDASVLAPSLDGASPRTIA